MKIIRAYCLEMNRVVDIYQARDHYFDIYSSIDLDKRRRFQFLCSDENCRTKNKTLVSGVNYDKLIEETDNYVRPHFRDLGKHMDDCEWVEFEQVTDEIEAEAEQDSSSRPRQTRHVKRTDVVDIFAPGRDDDETGSEGLVGTDEYERVRRMPDARSRREALKTLLRRSPSQSSILENVVSSYHLLTTKQRESTMLTVKGIGERSYGEWFKHVKGCTLHDDTFIYYGGAWVKAYADGSFALNFFDEVTIDETPHKLSMYLKADRIKRFKSQAYLQTMLEELSRSHEPISEKSGEREEAGKAWDYATCYFFGHITLSDKGAGYLRANVDHLNNLVLIPKSKHRK